MAGQTISINDEVTPLLEDLDKYLASRPLRALIGASAARLTRKHFDGLERARHRPHVRHHFYARAANATTWEATNDDALVIIDHVGIAQRYYGGILRPSKAKRLTIPLNETADNYRAREIPGLFYLKTRSKKEFLARKESGSLRFYFILKKSVSQDADKTVLPSNDDYAKAISQSISDYLATRGAE